jgi:hypothetical protein
MTIGIGPSSNEYEKRHPYQFRERTSFQPKVTCSPSESPEPEKSSVNTVIFEGKSIIATSLASALHPLRKA